MPDIAVYLIEDQDAIRQALCLLLDGTPGFCCRGAAASAETALQDEAAAPDVVLLDIGLPGLSGLEAIDPLRRRWPQASILMFTVHDEDDRVFEALCAGATGYLLKSTPPARLLDAIAEVHAGGAPMSASVARKVVHTFHRPRPAAEMLSAREQEVLDLLIDGRSYKQIAEALFISVNTVSYHVKQIYGKLHVRSRAEVMARATRRWG